LAVVARTENQAKAQEWGTVLEAKGIPYRLIPDGPRWAVEVDLSRAEAACQEIAAFERENPEPASGSQSLQVKVQAAFPLVIPVLGVLAAFHLFSGTYGLMRAGRIDGESILVDHEWYRLLTALFLHADWAHLAGNIFFGGIFAWFLCRELGSGLGWLLLFFSGVVGNGVNTLLKGESALSVGFSTSVFGAVGLLAGLKLAGGKVRIREGIFAVGGALALLAFLGSEGERTDLGAHLWGTVTGGVLGLSAGFAGLRQRARNRVFQLCCWAFLAGIVSICWWLALSRG